MSPTLTDINVSLVLVIIILAFKYIVYWLSMVLRLRQHNIGYTANGFYRSDDPTKYIV